MCSPTSPQTASSTHWPSWSQAPFWWGSPKSPTTMGPSTALTISARVISAGGAGQHVAAADAPLRAHQAGALEGEQDLLEVGLGEAGALGDVAHRRRACLVGVQREREQRPAGVVTPRRHLHAGHRTAGVRSADGRCRDRLARGRRRCGTLAPEASPRGRPSRAPRLRRRLHQQRRARPARAGRRTGRRRGCPPPVAGADQVVLLVLDGLGWDQLQARRAPGADAGGHGRRPDHTVVPVHHGHRPDLDRHRPAAGRARRGRLPHRRATARSSTCCAGRTAAGDARRRIPPDRAPAARRRSAGTGRRSSPGPSSPAPGFTARPPRRRPLHAAGGCRRRS